MIVKPFRGFRPSPELAARVPSVPYDVVTSAEARELAQDNPQSFLHVIRPEIDLDPTIDTGNPSRLPSGPTMHGSA